MKENKNGINENMQSSSELVAVTTNNNVKRNTWIKARSY